jgi:hypothetical protein
MNSVIIDLFWPDHRRLVKLVNFLLKHPEEVAAQSVEGLSTHQPLLGSSRASSSLQQTTAVAGDVGGKGKGTTAVAATTITMSTPPLQLATLSFMRVRVDSALVNAVHRVVAPLPRLGGGEGSNDDVLLNPGMRIGTDWD